MTLSISDTRMHAAPAATRTLYLRHMSVVPDHPATTFNPLAEYLAARESTLYDLFDGRARYKVNSPDTPKRSTVSLSPGVGCVLTGWTSPF